MRGGLRFENGGEVLRKSTEEGPQALQTKPRRDKKISTPNQKALYIVSKLALLGRLEARRKSSNHNQEALPDVGKFGLRLRSGRGGNRTPDTRIFSPLLYRLSYPPIKKIFPMREERAKVIINNHGLSMDNLCDNPG